MIYPARQPRLAAIIQHYEELDPFYRELWGEHIHHGLWRSGRESPEEASHQLATHAIQSARVQAGERVCDVGSGYGGVARLLAHEYRAQVTALTPSPTQHAYARAATPNRHNPTYLLRDWSNNGLPSAAYDAVLALESTEHVADKRHCFAEVARVLKPGGRLVVCAWLAQAAPPPWKVRYLLKPICREGQIPSLGTATEYNRLLHAAGLTVETFEDLSPYVAQTWSVCIARTMKALGHQPHYWRYLLDHRNRNRGFARTLARIRVAYATGALRYGLFVARHI